MTFKLRIVLTVKPCTQKKHSSLDSELSVYDPSEELNCFNFTEVERQRTTMACASFCASFHIIALKLKQNLLPQLQWKGKIYVFLYYILKVLFSRKILIFVEFSIEWMRLKCFILHWHCEIFFSSFYIFTTGVFSGYTAVLEADTWFCWHQ